MGKWLMKKKIAIFLIFAMVFSMFPGTIGFFPKKAYAGPLLTGDITLSVENSDPATYAGNYGLELTSGEAGTEILDPGIEVCFTDKNGNITGDVSVSDLSWSFMDVTGSGIYHSLHGDPDNMNYDDWQPNINNSRFTKYMIIKRTDGNAFSFKEMKVLFAVPMTLQIEGFKNGGSTGVVEYENPVANSGKAVRTTLGVSTLDQTKFGNVDEVKVTGKNYLEAVWPYLATGTLALVTGYDTHFTSFTIGDPIGPSSINVTGITVRGAGDLSSVTTGNTLQMEATIAPDNATNKEVTWSVENGTGSATISNTGLLTAGNVGTVTVKATAKDGSGVVGSKTITIEAALSNACDVTSWTAPASPTVTGTNVTKTVGNEVTSLTVDAAVSANASWKLYSNASCTAEITDKTMNLAVGDNIVYLKVIAENGVTTKTYTITITREAYVPSSACDITSWTTPATPTVSGTNVTKTVGNEVTSLIVNAAVSANATWKLYSDAACTTEITDKTMNLNVGANVAYLKVTAEDGVTTKTYTITIAREAYVPSSACDVTGWISPDTPTETGTSVTKILGNEITSLVVDVVVSANASWKLYSDEDCTEEIADKTMNLNVGANVAYLKVTAEDEIATKTYSVTITREPSSACDVTSWTTPASPTVTGTNVTKAVGNEVTSLVVNAAVSTNASWKLYSDADCTEEITDKTMNLNVGVNTAYLKVTAEDGVTTKIYTITLAREAYVPSSACDVTGWISPDTPTETGTSVTKTLGNEITSLVVNAAVSANATWKLYSDVDCTEEITNKTMNLAVGSNTAYLKVTAEDGITTKTYTVTITREPSSACDVVVWTTPATPTVTGTTVTKTLGNEVISLVVDATVSANASWKLYSDLLCTTEIDSKTMNLNVGANAAYLKVTAEDGTTTKTYTVTITREPSSACDVISWTTPASPTVTGITVTKTVGNEVTSLIVNAAVSANATWKLYSDLACTTEITNKTMSLNVGANTAYLKVTAEDGNTTKIYTVTITREAPSLSSACEVTSWTTPATPTVSGTTVTKTVGNEVTSLVVDATVSDNASWKLYSDLLCTTEIDSKTMNLNVGANAAYLKVTAEDGTTTKTYTVTITREPSSACDVVVWTTPASPTVTGTTVTKTVGNEVTSLVVNATVSANASWKLYSDLACTTEIVNKTMNLNVGANTAYLKVTAEDGITTKTYTVTITREPSSACDVVVWTTPASPTVTGTTVTKTVGNEVTSLVVDTTVSDNASWKLYSDLLCTTEIDSKTMNLNVGENAAYLKVIAEDGITTKTYTVTITREPSSACDVTSWTTPATPTVSGTTVTKTVGNEVTRLVVNATVSANASWKLYSDVACTTEIVDKTMILAVGANVAYLKVTAEDGITTKTYTVTITREPSTSCDVTGWTAPLQLTVNGLSVSKTVDYSTWSLAVDVAVSENAAWKLYIDENCTQEINNKTMNLNEGINKAYLKVTAQDGSTSKKYTLTITREAAPYIPPYVPPTVDPKPNDGSDKEQIMVDVTDGKSDSAVSGTPVERVTEKDGTKKDTVKFEEDKAKEAIDKIKADGKDTARIVIPDKKDEVAETKVEIPKDTISVIEKGKINLEIDTENARINIPKESIENLSTTSQEDLFFRIVPIKKDEEKNQVIERVQQATEIREAVNSNNVSVIGRPSVIETNMTQRPVDIILPLKDVVIPNDPREMVDFLSKLAVFVEHSDKDKEVIKGEIVKYKDGVLGIKFRITRFSTFTIIKADTPELSKACDIVKVNAPIAAELKETSITKTVSNGTVNITLDVAVSEKATWKLYRDEVCTKEIANKQLGLKVGDNKAYLKVTAENGKDSKIYTITIKRKEKVILIATKNDFADAYAGEVLAKKLDGEIILTGKTDKEVQSLVSYITKNLTVNDTIYIFGLSVAIKNDVEKILKSKGYKNIIRIGGEDKYETAKKISEKLSPKKGTIVVLVNGDKIPQDGVNIKKVASEKGYPILFVKKDSLTKYTIAALKNINPTYVYIVGDATQISDKAIKELQKELKIKPANIIRIKSSKDMKK